MALNWNWEDKCGEITLRQIHEGEETKEYTINLYQGNATLIMIQEYTGDNGEDMYELFSFFADKQHMKNSLGLAKGEYNIFNTPYQTITKLCLNKAKNRHWKDIVAAFAAAFDKISIEIYNA